MTTLMKFLSKEQEEAIQIVARAHGWDLLSADELGKLTFCLFHYFVSRLDGGRK